MVRLFIYNREAQDKAEPERTILQNQFSIMIKRLWFGITWPSCVLTIIFGTWLTLMLGSIPSWLQIKLGFIVGLLLYHISLHVIYLQQKKNIFKYSSQLLRVWNEVATIFLIAIVLLVEVKTSLSVVWGLIGLILFALLLLMAIRIYKKARKN